MKQGTESIDFEIEVKLNLLCRSVIVPLVECEDVTDKRCVKLPSVEETELDAIACTPVVDKPKCDKVIDGNRFTHNS